MTNRIQTPPNLIGLPKVNVFIKNDFNRAIWDNGYDVILESAISCPCKGVAAANLTDCSNCLGSGWVFVNPIETRAVITSINKETKYKEWSPEFIGTISVTFMDSDRFGFMDKITLKNHFGVISENVRLNPSSLEGFEKFIFTTYRIEEVLSVHVFSDINSDLVKLKNTDYEINQNKYVLDIKKSALPLVLNGSISITYKHSVTYNIIDIPHDIRVSKEFDNNGTRKTINMPIQAIARKSQYELGVATKYTGDNIINNSWL